MLEMQLCDSLHQQWLVEMNISWKLAH